MTEKGALKEAFSFEYAYLKAFSLSLPLSLSAWSFCIREQLGDDCALFCTLSMPATSMWTHSHTDCVYAVRAAGQGHGQLVSKRTSTSVSDCVSEWVYVHTFAMPSSKVAVVLRGQNPWPLPLTPFRLFIAHKISVNCTIKWTTLLISSSQLILSACICD